MNLLVWLLFNCKRVFVGFVLYVFLLLGVVDYDEVEVFSFVI